MSAIWMLLFLLILIFNTSPGSYRLKIAPIRFSLNYRTILCFLISVLLGLHEARISAVIQSECNPEMAFLWGFFSGISLGHFFPPQKWQRKVEVWYTSDCFTMRIIGGNFFDKSDYPKKTLLDIFLICSSSGEGSLGAGTIVVWCLLLFLCIIYSVIYYFIIFNLELFLYFFIIHDFNLIKEWLNIIYKKNQKLLKIMCFF